jgi:hypothetical protein
MNKERIIHYLTQIETWETDTPSLKDAQQTTKALMNELFPNLPKDYLNWLAGNFIASHYKENQNAFYKPW